MAKIIDLRKFGIKDTVLKSISKRRTTFWSMMRSMAHLDYKPSLLLVITFLFATLYLIAQKFILPPLLIRLAGTIIVLVVLLKTLSNETYRYSRFKARSRRHCE
jgi:hypothetical protein